MTHLGFQSCKFPGDKDEACWPLSASYSTVSALPPDSVTLQASSRDSVQGPGSGRGKVVSSETELAHICARGGLEVSQASLFLCLRMQCHKDIRDSIYKHLSLLPLIALSLSIISALINDLVAKGQHKMLLASHHLLWHRQHSGGSVI